MPEFKESGRVVITGMGVLTPKASCVAEFNTALRESRSGVVFWPEAAASGLGCQVAGLPRPPVETLDTLLTPPRRRPLSSLMEYAVLAALECWRFFLSQVVVLASIARTAAQGIQFILLGTALPFLVFTYLIALAVFLHHTHPNVAWHRDVSQYDFFSQHTRSSVHVELPCPLEILLHNIMCHTAHHIQPRILLYDLSIAQKLVELAHPEVIRQRWILQSWHTTPRTGISIAECVDVGSNHV